MSKMLLLMVFLTFNLFPVSAEALDYPHDYSCTVCHITIRNQAEGTTGINNVCLGCHKTGGLAPEKAFDFGDMANPFKRTNGLPTNGMQTSHNWSSSDDAPQAGASPPVNSQMNLPSSITGVVSCVRCHAIHAPADDPDRSRPFLRMKNDNDEMCLECHRVRNSATQQLGSHPVNIVYTSASAKPRLKPTEYLPIPAVNSMNKTAEMRLKNGKVLCSTCHGVHYSDSNARTFDVRSSVKLGLLSSSQGFLLRADLKAPLASLKNICTNCHIKPNHDTKGQNIQCADCHAGHVDVADGTVPNVYLLRRYMNISTQFGKVVNRKVFFQSTSAKNYSASDPEKPGVCQSCHQVPNGGNYPPEHEIKDNSKICNVCHSHNSTVGAFSAQCTLCHGFPPQQNIPGGPQGFAKNAGFDYSLSATYKDEGATAHKRHAGGYDDYRLACSQCHNGNSHNTGSFVDVFKNTSGAVASSFGANPQYSFSGNGTCTLVYCHSNAKPFDKTNQFKTMSWQNGGSQGCTSCHGGAGLATELSGRHNRHTGGDYAFSCERCHSATISGSLTIADKMKHVNGRKDLVFSDGGDYNTATMACTNTYCHSNGGSGSPTIPVKWSDSGVTMKCFSCHKGRTFDETPENCAEILGNWDSAGFCTPAVSMSSNGHARLVGKQWIRQYPCTFCHDATIDASGAIKDLPLHLNKVKNVVMSSEWAVVGKDAPSYDSVTKICDNVYCHTDGTAGSDNNRPYSWTQGKTECNSCHGHPRGSCQNAQCHDGRTDLDGKVWPVKTGWPLGEDWKAAMPMYSNGGPGTPLANSHPRHLQSNFTCAECHAATIKNGECNSCHASLLGSMGEVAHIDPVTHVNRQREVSFRQGGSYNPITKSCSNTACHRSGTDPVWGGSLGDSTDCYNCHGVVGVDFDDFGNQNGIQAKISLEEWTITGHGRPTSAGPYPGTGNPAANFPVNPCWYCHDPNIQHKDSANPFRLRQHSQFVKRFEKECVYCHMEGKDVECLGCHDAAESLAPQLSSIYPPKFTRDHRSYVGGGASCVATCHATNSTRHKTSTGLWTATQKADIRNQYVMMGVCLKCHDDDSGGRCTSCHNVNPTKYALGFNPLLPGTGFIIPQKARASSVHFGHKHYAGYQQTGVWKGGKFCWDCHDPHGDANIFMIQTQVATTTDGTFGIPQTRAQVSFTKKQSGLDYARINAPYNGICNVCHTAGSQHYRVDGGDGHNSSRVCTGCHEHRFTDSHADKKACNTCHLNKPVPRHSAFGLPRDCTKCHGGIIGKRTDVMGQFRSNSHHVQGAEVTNKQCYVCHWEATSLGLIDVRYHKGYNHLTYSSVKNSPVELVIWGPGTRPTGYKLYSTAVQFVATNMGTAKERGEVAKITLVCVGCHSDQNNDTQPFRNTTSQCNNDLKTPRQYSWDKSSVASRYNQKGTTTWGKYDSNVYPASKKDTVVKAFSAHGNAAANQGGWSAASGYDGAIPQTRGGSGAKNVECFDCHNSHGSKVSGVTSSYLTFNGTNNGANLKETQAGKGGYGVTYMAQANPAGVNKYAAAAGQCFDCHETAMAETTPWGYSGSFGATAPILGYKDTSRFGQGTKGSTARFSYRDSRKTIVGGHLQASSFLKYSASRKINGLCTPCHDPHGVSQSLGANQAYGVPLLKGTWLTSPYREDRPAPTPVGNSVNVDGSGTPRSWGRYVTPPSPTEPSANYNLDRTTLGGATRISEEENQFAGLCLSCHRKDNLNSTRGSQFKTTERIHEAVKGWGNNREHSYSCSKCHQPHNSGLPRLMQTNCLNFNHRGERPSGGQAWSADSESTVAHELGSQHRGYPIANLLGNSDTAEATGSCHGAAVNNPGTWPEKNLWNNLTPW